MSYRKIQLRQDTSARFNSKNPVLLYGEPAIETDTGRIKIGDGVSNYSNLPYQDADLRVQQEINDRIYQGTDLTVKFAKEIAGFSDEWAWIKSRIAAGNFTGIHIGDYIPVAMSAGTVGTDSVAAQTFKCQVAGIDTYYQAGDTPIPHHIDFVSKEVIDKEVKWNPVDNNNGTSVNQYPWLASALYGWLNGKNNYTTSAYGNAAHGISAEGKGILQLLPSKLQNVIVEKRMLLEKRYSSSGLLSNSIGWDWKDAGKLWTLTELEVYGTLIWSGSFPGTEVHAWASMCTDQYPLFANNVGSNGRLKKMSTGGRSTWWLLAARGGASSGVCRVDGSGGAGSYLTTDAGIRVPLCFRVC